MTQTEKSSRKVINGAGWVNPLTHDYRVDLVADVHIYADNTELVSGVDYTVSNVANDAGYVVTITNAGAWAPTVWVLDARPAIDQQSNLSLGGQFGAAYEDAIDKLTRRLQRVFDLARRSLKTSPLLPVGDDTYSLPLPSADKLVGWNAIGTDLENKDPVLLDVALVDNDTSLTADSATRVASQHATRTFADAAAAAAQAGAVALSLQKSANLSDVANAGTARGNLAVGAYVLTRTALKAFDTTKDTVAWLGETNRWGQFVWRTGDWSALGAIDTQEGYVIKANTIALTAGAWVRNTASLSPKMFGAAGDDTTNDDTAVNVWFAVLMATSLDGRVDGKFRVSTAKAWDFSARRITGVKITGDGPNTSYFNVSDTTTSPAMYWHSNSQALFFSTFRDFGIRTNRAGVGFQIGQDNFADAWNQCVFDNMTSNNAAASAANVSLRVNQVLGSYWNFDANGGGSGRPGQPGAPGYGTSVEFRQAIGNRGVIHAGNSVTGHKYTGTGFSYGNNWGATDIEEVTNVIVIDGTNVLKNSYNGGYFVGSTIFTCTTGNNNSVDNANISFYAGGVLGANLFGMNIINEVASSAIQRSNASGHSVSTDTSSIAPAGHYHAYGATGPIKVRWQLNADIFDTDLVAGGVSQTFYKNNGTWFTNIVGATAAYQHQINSTLVETRDANGLLVAGKVISSDPTKGVGYGTGAGGAVAQATSKSTGVALNKVCGQITMNAAALAAGTIVSFTNTAALVAATDTIVANHISGGTLGSYTINARAAAGSVTFDVRNNTAGSLSEAIVIQYSVIKAVNA